LQRQSLFDEDDAARGLPKAAAAEARLRAINSEVAVRGVVADFAADNAAELLKGADLVLDGTDNFETRFLLNDVCVRGGIPWVYGACVGSYGLVLLVRPHVTPCLRCVLEEMPGPGGPTCDTVGVVAPVVHVVAGLQAAEALKLLAGRTEDLRPGVVTVDLWKGRFGVMDLAGRAPGCPACTEGRSGDARVVGVEAANGASDRLVQVPPGGQCFLGDEARRRRSIEERVVAVFEGWDYEEIIPPLFDYADVFASQALLPKTYSFVG